MRSHSTPLTLMVCVFLVVTLLPSLPMFAAAHTRFSVAADGSTRIIVGLRMAYQPEGALDSVQAVDAQRTAISQAQNRLWASLDPSEVTVIQQFASIPFMALKVDTAELTVLQSLPIVASIEEDALSTPL